MVAGKRRRKEWESTTKIEGKCEGTASDFTLPKCRILRSRSAEGFGVLKGLFESVSEKGVVFVLKVDGEEIASVGPKDMGSALHEFRFVVCLVSQTQPNR